MGLIWVGNCVPYTSSSIVPVTHLAMGLLIDISKHPKHLLTELAIFLPEGTDTSFLLRGLSSNDRNTNGVAEAAY